MEPTSCRYSPLPGDEHPKQMGARKLPVWVGIVGILLGLLVVGLLVAVGVLSAKINSPACKDGLRAEQECRNINHLLEQKLTQAQDALRGTEAQAATCNQTVETLKISLEEEKAGGRKQQELVQKLQEQIKSLNQSLQDKSTELDKKSAELQKLRQENEALVSAKCPPNSGISLRLSMTPVLLTLSLLALLA
ncbi:bone marrow stromal antigen 2-like isoform X2 [Pipistrellus kuhlii]|uniref:bone marrow stromal antigen 2-like isoform X2 n=1 Tax=Pipistrellus kuhlii TaxID=59472 RepID=UPI001E27031E|nr:bone marrow stromal antigen 2-like isoform X2 [Pipistrellus kuhlii]